MINLANLHKKTPQEVFDYVARHLLNQNSKSINLENLACAYRGSNSKKCSAGCLISDKEYLPSMEGTIWPDLVKQFDLTNVHLELIRSLQGIHDHNPPYMWPQKLKIVANALDLNKDVLNV